MIALTAGSQPSVQDFHLLFAENLTIKCSTVMSGVFPSVLGALLEGCQCESSTFTQIVAQCTN